MYGPSGMWAAGLCPSSCTPRGLARDGDDHGGRTGAQTATARQGSAVAIAWCMVARPSPRIVEVLAE